MQGVFPNDTACRDRFIREFGLKAFRRPLRPRRRWLCTLFSQAATQQKDFLAGASWWWKRCCNPPASFSISKTVPTASSPQYGIASRLSYFLWDTMPDAELFRAAAAGEFETTAKIRKVAAPDDGYSTGQALVRRICGAVDALRPRAWVRAKRARQYTDFGPSLLAAMTEETKHLFDHLVWNDKNFMEMFSADYTFLSPRLAQLYGFETPSEDFGSREVSGRQYASRHPGPRRISHADG